MFDNSKTPEFTENLHKTDQSCISKSIFDNSPLIFIEKLLKIESLKLRIKKDS